LQALVEYTVHERLREVSTLTVEIEASSQGGKTQSLSIDNSNLAQLQSIEVSITTSSMDSQISTEVLAFRSFEQFSSVYFNWHVYFFLRYLMHGVQ